MERGSSSGTSVAGSVEKGRWAHDWKAGDLSREAAKRSSTGVPCEEENDDGMTVEVASELQVPRVKSCLCVA